MVKWLGDIHAVYLSEWTCGSSGEWAVRDVEVVEEGQI